MEPTAMLNTNEQFAAVQKANLELLRGVATKAFETAEQLSALNLKVARASFEDVAEASAAALAAPDVQQLAAVPSALLQPAAEKAASYGRELTDILAGAKAEFDKVAAAQTAAAQKSLQSAFEAVGANLQAFGVAAAQAAPNATR
jgi:phasin family protein